MVMAQRKVRNNHPYEDLYGESYAIPKRKKISPPKKAAKVHKLGFIVMMALIAVFGLIGALTVYTTVVKAAEVRSLEKDIQSLAMEQDLLQVEVDKLSSVARIEKVALAMGMENPKGTIYIAGSVIEPEKETGVEQTQKTAAEPGKGKADSVLERISKVIAGFFASTQR